MSRFKWLRASGLVALCGVIAFAVPATAEAQCTDISDTCQTTAPEDCSDAVGSTFVVQIGGPGAEDSNDDGGTCQGTDAVVLLTFEKESATQYSVIANNATCGDNASMTAFFHNITDTVTGLAGVGLSAIAGTIDETWALSYEQTTPTDGDNNNGPKADGFGHFDAVIFNGDSTSPNGGNKNDIRAGEIFQFFVNVAPGYDLCDILTEISTPTPGERNRVAVGRFQACGAGEQNSAYIGTCSGDDPLLAVIRQFVLTPGDGNMTVDWETSLEVENAGFNVLRRELRGGQWTYVNADFIAGAGDSVTGASYRFIDDSALNGVQYQYRVEDVDFNGKLSLNQTDSGVPNPRNPMVRLSTPSYGATVSATHGLKLGWDNTGVHGSGVLQISPDPTFTGAVTQRVPLRFGASEIKLSPRTLSQLEAAGSPLYYWRVTDTNLSPISDTFLLEVGE